MAFKMNGFNPGVGTGMNSALKKSSSFKRDDKYVANNPDAKNPDPDAGKVEKLTFKEAFKRAREQGKKTFTWEGKSYTTELASNDVEGTTDTRAKEAEEDNTSPDRRQRGGKRRRRGGPNVDAIKNQIKRLLQELNNSMEMIKNMVKRKVARAKIEMHRRKIKDIRERIAALREQLKNAAVTGVSESASERVTPRGPNPKF